MTTTPSEAETPGQQLATYVKSTPTDATYVDDCAAQAEAVVAEALRTSTPGVERPCPADLRNRAVLEVGAELFARRGLRNGIATFGVGDDGLQPVRVSRDPMHLARSILAPYMGGPFA